MFTRRKRAGSASGSSDQLTEPPLAIGSPTDTRRDGSVTKLQDGELGASEEVPPEVVAMLASLKPAEVSAPTGVQRHASVQITESGELRASEMVPKEVLALLPSAALGAVDISRPTCVTKRGGAHHPSAHRPSAPRLL